MITEEGKKLQRRTSAAGEHRLLPPRTQPMTLSTTIVMIKQQPIRLNGSGRRHSPRNYPIVGSSTDNVQYCCLHLKRSDLTSTYAILNDATCNVIINQRYKRMETYIQETRTTLVTKAWGTGGRLHPTFSVRKAEAQSAVAEPSRKPIVHEIVVPGIGAKSHR